MASVPPVSTGNDRLFVLWLEPGAGKRHVIGELWKDDDGYAFAYGYEFEDARRRGFPFLLEFPEPRELDRPYRSRQLFSTFAQRLPSPKRPDYESMLASWGVSNSDSPLHILALSGGIQLTDRIEVAQYRQPDDLLDTPLIFRVAGEEHYAGSADVKTGDALRLVREPWNEHDSNAVAVFTNASKKLGYVPRQYSTIVARCMDSNVALTAIAVRRLLTPDDRDRWVVRASRARH